MASWPSPIWTGKNPSPTGRRYPLPVLVLLDLSMPGKHGLERAAVDSLQPTLTSLPVIVLTSSNQESDIHRAYLLGANGYLIKPGDPDDLIRIVRAIQQYWLSDIRPTGKFVDFTGAGNVKSVNTR